MPALFHKCRESQLNDCNGFFTSEDLHSSLLVALGWERARGEAVQAGEEAVPGLGLEVEDAAHRAVVLPHGLVQVDPRHVALREVDRAQVGDPPLLVAVHPDLLPHHQHVRVLVQDHVRGALPPQPSLGHPPPLQLRRVDVLGLAACGGAAPLVAARAGAAPLERAGARATARQAVVSVAGVAALEARAGAAPAEAVLARALHAGVRGVAVAAAALQVEVLAGLPAVAGRLAAAAAAHVAGDGARAAPVVVITLRAAAAVLRALGLAPRGAEPGAGGAGVLGVAVAPVPESQPVLRSSSVQRLVRVRRHAGAAPPLLRGQRGPAHAQPPGLAGQPLDVRVLVYLEAAGGGARGGVFVVVGRGQRGLAGGELPAGQPVAVPPVRQPDAAAPPVGLGAVAASVAEAGLRRPPRAAGLGRGAAPRAEAAAVHAAAAAAPANTAAPVSRGVQDLVSVPANTKYLMYSRKIYPFTSQLLYLVKFNAHGLK